jgi:hypothetical protein
MIKIVRRIRYPKVKIVEMHKLVKGKTGLRVILVIMKKSKMLNKNRE